MSLTSYIRFVHLAYSVYHIFVLDVGSKDDTKKVLSIAIPIVVVMILLIAVCIFFWRKRATKHARGKYKLSINPSSKIFIRSSCDKDNHKNQN